MGFSLLTEAGALVGCVLFVCAAISFVRYVRRNDTGPPRYVDSDGTSAWRSYQKEGKN